MNEPGHMMQEKSREETPNNRLLGGSNQQSLLGDENQNPSAMSKYQGENKLKAGDEMGWMFDYAFYCYKFFQNLLFLQAITFVIFCQFTQDYFMDILKKWSFTCQAWFWQVTGVQYSIAILTIFCYFQKHEAIAHLAKDSLGIRVAIKVSIELVTF